MVTLTVSSALHSFSILRKSSILPCWVLAAPVCAQAPYWLQSSDDITVQNCASSLQVNWARWLLKLPSNSSHPMILFCDSCTMIPGCYTTFYLHHLMGWGESHRQEYYSHFWSVNTTKQWQRTNETMNINLLHPFQGGWEIRSLAAENSHWVCSLPCAGRVSEARWSTSLLDVPAEDIYRHGIMPGKKHNC